MQYATEPQLSTAPFDEVTARRQLRAVRETGIEAPTGELYFEAAEWLREVEDHGPWRPSVVRVARVLAREFDATGTITLTHTIIAKRAKLRGTATEDALRELDQAGWLGRDQQLGGRGRGAVYTAFFASYMGAEPPEKGPAKRPEKRPALTRGRAERSLTVQEEELTSDSSSSEEGSTWWDGDDEARSAAKAAPEHLEEQPALEVGGMGFPAASKYGHNENHDDGLSRGGPSSTVTRPDGVPAAPRSVTKASDPELWQRLNDQLQAEALRKIAEHRRIFGDAGPSATDDDADIPY